MELLRKLIEFLVAIGVLITGVRIYLMTNKLWKRKHLAQVVESVSVMACLLVIMAFSPVALKLAFIDRSLSPALTQGIIVVGYTVILFIGSGFWLPANRKTNPFRLFLRALNLERQESAYLIKQLLNPERAEHLLKILEQLAAIDDVIMEKEIDLIRRLADQWNLELPPLTPGPVENRVSIFTLRTTLAEYLDSAPPKVQVGELIDLLNLMIKSDDQVSSEEQIVLEELTGLINAYVNDNSEPRQMYEVVIVPQNKSQCRAIKELLPEAKAEACASGEIFIAGSFYSVQYAKEICEKYVALNVFTHYRKTVM